MFKWAKQIKDVVVPVLFCPVFQSKQFHKTRFEHFFNIDVTFNAASLFLVCSAFQFITVKTDP